MSVPLRNPLTRNEICARAKDGYLTVVLEMTLDDVLQNHPDDFSKLVDSYIFANNDGILIKQQYRIVGHTTERTGCGQLLLEVTGMLELFKDTQVFAFKASSLDLCTRGMPLDIVYENRTFSLSKRVTDRKTGDLIMFIYKPEDNNSDDQLYVLMD